MKVFSSFEISSKDGRSIMALMALQSLAFMPMTLAPLYLSALMSSFGLSETHAGGLLSAEFLVLALTSVSIGSVINRFSWRHLILLSGILLTSGTGVSTLVSDAGSYLFIVARAVAAIGSGIAMAVAMAAIANMRNPDQAYGIIGAGGLVLAATVLALCGTALDAGGIQYLFALLLLVAIVLPIPALVAGISNSSKTEEEPDDHSTPVPALGVRTAYAVVALLIGLVINITWTYSHHLGTLTSLSPTNVVFWLGIGLYCSIPGNLIAGWLGLRFGRKPYFVSLLALGISTSLLFIWQNPDNFVQGQVVFGLAYGVVMPCMFGFAAVLDREGRWAAIISGIFMFSTVLSPLIGGYLFQHLDHKDTGALIVATNVLAGTVLAFIQRSMRSRARGLE